MKLSIIIPTFNEEATIGAVVGKIVATRFPVEIELILVDDHSSDRTLEIEQQLQKQYPQIPVHLFRNESLQGKGASIALGLSRCSGDFVVIQDADLEYDPAELPKLLAPLLDGSAQVVYGSRFLFKRWPSGMAWPNWLANWTLTRLANRLYGLQLTDAYTCYKIIPRDLLNALQLKTNGFEWEAEITAKLGQRKIRIAERPVSYQGRTVKSGKKIKFADFFKGVRTLLKP